MILICNLYSDSFSFDLNLPEFWGANGIHEVLRLQVGKNTVSVASSVKNLGVYFETSLSAVREVNAISKACYYRFRNIGHIRRYITDDTATESTEFFCQVSHSHS